MASTSGNTRFAISVSDRFHAEDFMDILAAIKREEKKLEKQLGKLQRQLNGVRAVFKSLGRPDESRSNNH